MAAELQELNALHGHGKCTYQNGDVYDGEWIHDQRAGHGTMIYKNEDVYTSEWQDDLRHGAGIFQYRQEPPKQQHVEVQHEGHWHMDHRCGPGTTSYTDGSQLVANWDEGGFVTSGKLENYDDNNGACSYEGEISNGIPHGEGSSEHHHSGETYTGHWHLGQRSGYGVATLRDGTTYRGDWKNGKRNGAGTCNYARTRDRYSGKWVGGVRCGRGTCTYANGCVYTGDWRDDKCHGHGTCTFADGMLYEGNWTDNTFGGDGAMAFSLNEDLRL
ncbi:Radial spoke head protein, partial [Globisporangium splendens]